MGSFVFRPSTILMALFIWWGWSMDGIIQSASGFPIFPIPQRETTHSKVGYIAVEDKETRAKEHETPIEIDSIESMLDEWIVTSIVELLGHDSASDLPGRFKRTPEMDNSAIATALNNSTTAAATSESTTAVVTNESTTASNMNDSTTEAITVTNNSTVPAVTNDSQMMEGNETQAVKEMDNNNLVEEDYDQDTENLDSDVNGSEDNQTFVEGNSTSFNSTVVKSEVDLEPYWKCSHYFIALGVGVVCGGILYAVVYVICVQYHKRHGAYDCESEYTEYPKGSGAIAGEYKHKSEAYYHENPMKKRAKKLPSERIDPAPAAVNPVWQPTTKAEGDVGTSAGASAKP